MAIDPSDIRLRDDERRRIANIAEESGGDWVELISDMIDSAEAVIGIKRGLDSVRRGEGRESWEVHKRLSNKYDLAGE